MPAESRHRLARFRVFFLVAGHHPATNHPQTMENDTMRRTTVLNALCGSRVAKRLPDAITDICRLTIPEMMERGISRRDAERVSAAVELAREIAEPVSEYRARINSPSTAIQYCKATFPALMNHGVQEEFWVVTLDTKNQPIGRHQVTVGTLRNSLVHPREFFRPAIADAACSVIALHNHPSGDPTPSDQDISVTERLESAAEIIGIPVIDHIVIASDRCISIREWRSGNRW